MFTKDFDKTATPDGSTPNAVLRDDASLPFRDRIRARDSVRPQSTLAIVAGIDGSEEAVTARRRNRGTYHATAAGTGALGAGGFDETHAISRKSDGRGDGGGGPGGFDDDDDVGSRLGDISQFAFAGLAVLGLAGLSVLAAESALNGPDNGKTPGTPSGGEVGAATVAGIATQPGDTSTVAINTAAVNQVAATPWFDYRGAADMLAKRQAEIEAQRVADEADATRLAETEAATAIADAEAKRLAEEAAQIASATSAANAADEAQAKRLADIEVERVAKLEADRLAKEKADAEAAAQAEATRQAELEAKRLAEAEAETKRLAEAEADRKAKAAAEVKRLAAIEKANAEAAAAQKLADEKAAAEKAEATRLAKAEADDEAKRLAKVEADRAAKAEAARLAKVEADRKAQQAAVAPVRRAAPAPIRFVAYTGEIPEPASRKPERSGLTLVSSSVSTTTAPTRRVVTNSPTTYYGSTATRVTPLGQSAQTRAAAPVASSQTVDDFLATRVQKTAETVVPMGDLAGLKAQFLNMVENDVDGARRTFLTPDGREVNVHLESTRPIEAVTKTVRTLDVTTVSSTDTSRFAGNAVPVKVSVMCRDVSYAFPGQERGRFAACERPDGGWMLARAADPGAWPT